MEERSQHRLYVLTQDTDARLAGACSHSPREQTRTSCESTVNKMISLVRMCRSLLLYFPPNRLLNIFLIKTDLSNFIYIPHVSCYHSITNLMSVCVRLVCVCVFKTWCGCRLAAVSRFVTQDQVSAWLSASLSRLKSLSSSSIEVTDVWPEWWSRANTHSPLQWCARVPWDP